MNFSPFQKRFSILISKVLFAFTQTFGILKDFHLDPISNHRSKTSVQFFEAQRSSNSSRSSTNDDKHKQLSAWSRILVSSCFCCYFSWATIDFRIVFWFFWLTFFYPFLKLNFLSHWSDCPAIHFKIDWNSSCPHFFRCLRLFFYFFFCLFCFDATDLCYCHRCYWRGLLPTTFFNWKIKMSAVSVWNKQNEISTLKSSFDFFFSVSPCCTKFVLWEMASFRTLAFSQKLCLSQL